MRWWLVGLLLIAACGPAGTPPSRSPPAPAVAAPPGAGAAIQSTAPAPAARDALRLAYGSNTGVQAPFVAAVSEGFLARQGIDARVSYVQGSRVGVAAVMAGELDVLSTAGPAVVAAQLGGADLVWVGDLINQLVFAVVADPSIRQLADLRGKRIGVSGVGTSSDTAARLVATRAGLRVGDDVTLLNAGGMTEIVTLLQERAIDAGVVSLSTTTQAKRLGYAELVNLANLDIAYPFTGLVVRRSWAEANRDLLVRFLIGEMDAVEALKVDKALALRVLQGFLEVEDTGALSDDYDSYARYFREALDPSIPPMRTALDELAPGNPAAAAADPASFIDASYAAAATARRQAAAR
jgi:ABC-type nitrate/sulfonate/bicarbonate transport system substrate-binding protein